MKKICFITGTRADYGIMSPLMQELHKRRDIELQIVATNMHLSPEHGMTVNEIIADGLPVSWRIDSLLSGDSPEATVKSMGLTQIGMADALSHLRPDLIVILGDRYEMLAAASSALIFRIPVAHLYGGETTEGAYDDCIRHAITQLSTYHFTSTREYADRVIRMGADPANVHWVGSLGADNIEASLRASSLSDDKTAAEMFLPMQAVADYLGWDPGERFVVATFHPVTTQPGEEERQTRSFLYALDGIIEQGWRIIFTMPNSDTGGKTVSLLIEEWAQRHSDSVRTTPSLGRRRYYTALHHAAAIVGNSSSGLIEAPSFGIPTLNVGDRQKGRAQGPSVVNVPSETAAISAGLEKVLSDDFRLFAHTAPNPYAKPDTLQSILTELTAGLYHNE